MFPCTEHWDEGTFGCSPAPRTGTRAHSPKPPFYETALLFRLELLADFGGLPLIRKILVSVKFVSAILGPERAAPILWAPGKMRSFCRKIHVHKIPRFRGGVFWVFWGGECRFYFFGREDFSDLKLQEFICESRMCTYRRCS